MSKTKKITITFTIQDVPPTNTIVSSIIEKVRLEELRASKIKANNSVIVDKMKELLESVRLEMQESVYDLGMCASNHFLHMHENVCKDSIYVTFVLQAANSVKRVKSLRFILSCPRDNEDNQYKFEPKISVKHEDKYPSVCSTDFVSVEETLKTYSSELEDMYRESRTK
tara:strand:+ start:71 stop:577 length:507 start_codon:yes stop_codon:yes gene_type:complete